MTAIETAETSPTSDLLVLTGRCIRRTLRQPDVLVQSVFFPVALLLMLLAVFSTSVEAVIDGPYVDQLLPLIVLEGAAFGAIGAGIGVRADLDSGLVDRMRTLPIMTGAVLFGRVGADAVRIAASSVVVVAVGYVVGFRFEQGILPALAFFAVAVGFGLAFTWLAVWIGMTSPTGEAVNAALSPVLLVLLFLSSGFVPVEGFPDWLQPVVRANPLSVASNALRGLAIDGPVLVPCLQTAAWAAGITAVCGTLSLRRWRRATSA